MKEKAMCTTATWMRKIIIRTNVRDYWTLETLMSAYMMSIHDIQHSLTILIETTKEEKPFRKF